MGPTTARTALVTTASRDVSPATASFRGTATRSPEPSGSETAPNTRGAECAGPRSGPRSSDGSPTGIATAASGAVTAATSSVTPVTAGLHMLTGFVTARSGIKT